MRAELIRQRAGELAARHPRWLKIIAGIVAAICAIVLLLFILSFFLNGAMRGPIQNEINKQLVGYHATLKHAHINLLTGKLTLTGLTIIQKSHPAPPVADFDKLTFHIHWGHLIGGHVVADVTLRHPRVHINTAQLSAEAHNGVPIQKEGWQQALENIYPFKINRFRIIDGDITYIDASDPQRPLHLEHVNLAANNIRNIVSPSRTYPSSVSMSAVAFGAGKITVEGHANFLSEPFPGIDVNYQLHNVPLSALTPASHHVNLDISGGTLNCHGTLEYSPKIELVEVAGGSLEDLNVDYVHHPSPVSNATARHAAAVAKREAKKALNQPATMIDIAQFQIKDSRFAYTDQASDPNYTLYISEANAQITNFSNHRRQGPAHVTLTGKFMGSGATDVTYNFLPVEKTADFNLNVAIRNTQLPSMNKLLRAYGRFDVAAGLLSVYAQLFVRHGFVHGYVKPLFSDLKIYSPSKDKNEGTLKKAYEMLLQAASDLFKNERTQKLATQFDISGPLHNTNANTWQAIVEVLHNAFVKAILPGFDLKARALIRP
jgi:hypothetical protein